MVPLQILASLGIQMALEFLIYMRVNKTNIKFYMNLAASHGNNYPDVL